MRKISKNIFLILCLAPFLVQCATKEDVRSTNIRVLSMDKKVEELQEKTVKKVQERQAKVSDRLDYLEAEILSLQGRLEENAHHNRLLREENKELIASQNAQIQRQTSRFTDKTDRLDKKIEANENRTTKAEARLSQAEVRLDQAESRIDLALKDTREIKEARAREAMLLAAEAAKAAEEAKKARLKATAPQEILPDKVKIDVNKKDEEKPPITGQNDPGQDMYDQALALFRAKKYTQASQIFSQFLAKYPESSMRANAMFWRGDSLYGLQNYDQAILEYQNVVINFPEHSKAPAALLKQGLAFEKLNDRETAGIVYKKILVEYPKSEQAASAQKSLADLKK